MASVVPWWGTFLSIMVGMLVLVGVPASVQALAARNMPPGARAAVSVCLAAFSYWFYRSVINNLLLHGTATSALELAHGGVGWLAVGMGLGAAVMLAALAIIRWRGALAVERSRLRRTTFLAALSPAVAPAFGEELLLRGCVYIPIAETSSTVVAILVTTAFAGVLHLANKPASAWTTLFIALQAGLVVSLLYVATHSIWICIGVHFAWNYLQALLLPAISGTALTSSPVVAPSGSELLTGGADGIEGSLPVTVLWIIVGTVAVALS